MTSKSRKGSARNVQNLKVKGISVDKAKNVQRGPDQPAVEGSKRGHSTLAGASEGPAARRFTIIAKKKGKNPIKRVKDLPAKRVTDEKGRSVKGGLPLGAPIRQIPPGPPI